MDVYVDGVQSTNVNLEANPQTEVTIIGDPQTSVDVAEEEKIGIEVEQENPVDVEIDGQIYEVGSGKGQDGFSPTVDVEKIENGHRVTITDIEGTETFDVMDGKDGVDATESIYIGDDPPETAKLWIELDEESTVLATLQAIQNDVTRAIQSIESSKEEQTKSIDVTANGSYDILPDSGKVLSKASVNVNVPSKPEQEKTLNVTENGTYTIKADSGKAISKAMVSVAVPERYDEGYSVGKQDGYNEGYSTGKEDGYTEGYNKGFDDNKPVVEPLEVTENGTYTPPVEIDGYNSVTVNVPLRYDEGYNDGFSKGKKEGYNEGYQASQDSIIYQEKMVEIAENGTTEILPDEGRVLSRVTVNVNVESSGGAGIDGMPSGYARVDYIQFTGKELIDTGIIGNQDTQINVSFTWESTTQRHLFGCASEDNTASITSYMNGSWRFGNKYSSKNLSTKNPNLPYSALVNKTTISLNSSTASISGVDDFETVGTLLLGGARDTDGSLPSVMITGKVFFFAIWQGEELVLKLVPVVSAEGEYRFFDMVSKTFFDSITDTPLNGGNL